MTAFDLAVADTLADPDWSLVELTLQPDDAGFRPATGPCSTGPTNWRQGACWRSSSGPRPPTRPPA